MEKRSRKSITPLGSIYFWTASFNKWFPLLHGDKNKDLIIDYLRLLSEEDKITVFGFVLMPTHLHFIWRLNCLNGKETPKASFMKFTAHTFRRQLEAEGKLNLFKVAAPNKRHEIWQRDALGIKIYNRRIAKQKLDYIHRNPVHGKWRLAKNEISYPYSSAKFYETGVDDFGFLKNIYREFGD